MSYEKSLLNRAVKLGIFTLGMIATTQLQALSMIESMPEIDYSPKPQLMIDQEFSLHDANGDLQLSVDEFYSLHESRAAIKFNDVFLAMDADQNGMVNIDEFVKFLPTELEEAAQSQFKVEAGDDGQIKAEEFVLMRLQERGVSPGLVWQFGLADNDNDGKLTPHELYEIPMTEPPVVKSPIVTEPTIFLVDPLLPELIEPPVIFGDPLPPELIESPLLTIESTPKVEPANTSTKLKAEATKDTINLTSPLEPDSGSLEKTAELTHKLAVLKKRMERVEKSISRTKEKLEMANADRKAGRLERRLKRQAERLNNLIGNYEETTKKLQDAQQMLESS